MTKTNYDLENRTTRFSEDIIVFLKTLERNIMNTPLISQFNKIRDKYWRELF